MWSCRVVSTTHFRTFCPVNSGDIIFGAFFHLPHTPGGQAFCLPSPQGSCSLSHSGSLSFYSQCSMLPSCALLLGTFHINGVVTWDLSCHPFSVSIRLPVPPCLANQPCISKNRLQAEALQQPGGCQARRWGLALAVRGTVLPPGSRLMCISQPAWGQDSATLPCWEISVVWLHFLYSLEAPTRCCFQGQRSLGT